MALYESAEDYLERILVLEESIGVNKVHSIDIANSFSYSKASVSVAMKHLRESKLIIFSPTDEIILTEEGRRIASKVYDRHSVLKKCLVLLGAPEDVADKDACKIEHDLSDITFDAIKSYYTEIIK